MQHTVVQSVPANRPVAIDVDGEPQGVVVPSPEGYRFLAVRLAAFAIDGQTFESVDAAKTALAAELQSHSR
jgi:hypothetical protein